MNELVTFDDVTEFLWVPENAKEMSSKNMKMQAVYRQLTSVAETNATVLLNGETGTGKGIMARLVHRLSERANKPFISVHCSAIPDSLLESELFGHVRGAFTGASRDKLGKFQLADGGTIFLDEVGTMPMLAQIKLLQVLQDKVVQRIGDEKTIKSNARVIAATNENLLTLCANKLFRSDLYYRLNVFPIEVPPLRERKEDIPALIDSFLERLHTIYNKKVPEISSDVYDAFETYEWPGNVRELENLIERAFIIEQSTKIGLGSLPQEIRFSELRSTENKPDGMQTMASFENMTLREAREIAVETLEREYLTATLTANRGKIKSTAEAAGVSTRQVSKLLNKHAISKDDFKSQNRHVLEELN